MSFNLFSTISTEMQASVTSSLSSTSGGWAGVAIQLITATVVMIITYQGLLVMAGKIQEPIHDLVWKLGCMAFLLFFLGNPEWLSSVNHAIHEIKNAFVGSDPFGILDTFVTDSLDTSKKLYASSGRFERIYLMPSFWVGVMSLVIVMFPVLLLNIIMLMLLLSATPLAIASLTSKVTKGVFSNWLQMIMANILTVMFLSIIMGAISKFTQIVAVGEIGNPELLCIAMIIIGFTAAKFAVMAVELGKGLASISVESARASVGAGQLSQKAAAVGGKFIYSKGKSLLSLK